MLVGKDGKIEKVGRAADVSIPSGYKTLRRKVVTPGLVDARATVGPHRLAQPEPRPGPARDLGPAAAGAARDRRLQRPGPADRVGPRLRHRPRSTPATRPGAVISGQTLIAKTRGDSVDARRVRAGGDDRGDARHERPRRRRQEPGTPAQDGGAAARRADQGAGVPARRSETAAKGKEPEPSLRSEALVPRAEGRACRCSVTVAARQRHPDARCASPTSSGSRSCSTARPRRYARARAIKKAGVPVIVHPTMARARRRAGERELRDRLGR